ncbi:group 1 truncated hemoglobin [Chitinophagaceae bacterium LWZ2-11]
MTKASFSAIAICVAFTITLATSSCKKDSTTTPATTSPTLYDSLGGTAMVSDPKNSGTKIEQGRLTIRSVVDSAIFVIAADASINKFFSVLLAEVTAGNTSGFAALSKNLTDFICVGTGAKNFTYGGKSMVAAHDPAQNPRMNGKANTSNFTQFEVDLTTAAGKNGIPSTAPAFQSLARIVESLRGQVVQQ